MKGTRRNKTIICASGAWTIGMLLTAVIGATALITDNNIPINLQGKQWIWLSTTILLAIPIWVIGCLWNIRFTSWLLSNVTEWVLLVFGTLQALYGLGQIMGYIPSGHSLFILTGTFYNPGPYSGYLASILPITLHHIFQARNSCSLMTKFQYYLSLLALLLICIILPTGMSRASWLASLISCSYVTYKFYHKQLIDFISKFKYIVLEILLIGILAIMGSYLLKRDSADGRLLIWKITSHAIADNPWGEENERTFSALYGDAQERYFTYEKYSESEVWVAGTPDYAFNEYLQIASEQGVWATMLMIVVLFGLLTIAGSCKHLIGIGGCLISLMVFACFSYPLHVPAIISVWILIVLTLFTKGLAMVRYEMAFKIILLLMALIGIMTFTNTYSLYFERTQIVRKWMPIRILYFSGAFKATAEEYGKLYKRMSWNKDFCFEYGRALYKAHQHHKAEDILLKAMKVSGDPMILNLLGRNAQDNGEYKKAESYLIRSTQRLPERIYPYYLLTKLYALPQYYHTKELKLAAKKVLFSKPKVKSTAIYEMRQEVKEILKKYEIKIEENINEKLTSHETDAF